MAYKDRFQLAMSDQDFRQAVTAAIVDAAVAINGEVQSGRSVAHWQARGQLALAVLRAPESYTTAFAFACLAADDTLNGASSDAAVDAAVSAVWSDLAYNQAQGA